MISRKLTFSFPIGYISQGNKRSIRMSTLGKEIKKARIEQGLKQKDLQALTGLSQKYLSEIENDVVDPRVSVLKKIAQALQVTTDSLLSLDKPEQATSNGSSQGPKHPRGRAKAKA